MYAPGISADVGTDSPQAPKGGSGIGVRLARADELRHLVELREVSSLAAAITAGWHTDAGQVEGQIAEGHEPATFLLHAFLSFVLADPGPSGDRFAQSFHQPFEVRYAFADCPDLAAQFVDVLPHPASRGEKHVPVVLALDEAQDVLARSTAGLATLGIPNISNENLASIHRSTRAIVKLAFYVIQRSTDLFGVDFPNFTGLSEHMEPDCHSLAVQPRVEVAAGESRGIGRFVVKKIRELRRNNLRQIAVICHSEAHYEALATELRATDLPLHELLTRGEKLDAGSSLVALTRPAYVGGQEFDAVILAGLEQGVVPPRVVGNDALAVVSRADQN